MNFRARMFCAAEKCDFNAARCVIWNSEQWREFNRSIGRDDYAPTTNEIHEEFDKWLECKFAPKSCIDCHYAKRGVAPDDWCDLTGTELTFNATIAGLCKMADCPLLQRNSNYELFIKNAES